MRHLRRNGWSIKYCHFSSLIFTHHISRLILVCLSVTACCIPVTVSASWQGSAVSVSRDTQHSALWLVGFDKPFLWFAVQVQHQWFLCRALQSHCSGQCHWPVRDLSPPFLLVCCQRSLCISDVGHSLYKWLYLEKCSAETELNGEWILEIFKFPHSHLPPAWSP